MIRRELITAFSLMVFCGTLHADEAKNPTKRVAQIKRIAVPAAQKTPLQLQLQKQREVSKRYSDSQTELKESLEKLAESEKQLREAKTEQAETEAKKQVEKVKAEVQKAQAAIAKARAAAAIQSRSLLGGSMRARTKVDATDTQERFALLLPGGPMLVQLTLHVDGKPFRTAREAMVSQMLTDADTNMDGRPTWKEAIRSPRFTYGRISISNEEQEKLQIGTFDLDNNGLVNRSEARQFLARFFRGPAFTLTEVRQNQGRMSAMIVPSRRMPHPGPVDVARLLDKDKDGGLSKKEIATAGDFLKSRDADDNDLLYMHELNAVAGSTANARLAIVNRSNLARKQISLFLGPTTDAALLFQTLQSQYAASSKPEGAPGGGEIKAKSFSSVPKLFAALDANQNGKLEQDEAMALNTVKPHLSLSIDLQNEDKQKQRIQITALADSLTQTNDSKGNNAQSLTLATEGARLNFTVNMNKTQKVDYSSTARSYMTRLDKDKNGHLDKRELQGSYARMMAIWDANQDGKVYPQEIIDSYNRMRAPTKTQVKSFVANHGNSLFQALDQSGDQRLSLREMRTADQRILEFDENQDGRVANSEVPISVSMSFGVGDARYTVARTTTSTPGKQQTTTKRAAPAWFTRMDRNGDGDLTLREFLGTENDFQALDTNHDGFIEVREAASANPVAKNAP